MSELDRYKLSELLIEIEEEIRVLETKREEIFKSLNRKED